MHPKDFELLHNWSLANKLELLIIPYIFTPLIYSYYSSDKLFLGWNTQDWVQFSIIITVPYILVPIVGLIISKREYRFKIFLHFYIISTLIAYLIFGAVGYGVFDSEITILMRMTKYGFLVVFAFPIALGVFYSVYREVEIYIFKYILIQNELDRSRNDIESLQQRITEQSKIIDYLKEVKSVITAQDSEIHTSS